MRALLVPRRQWIPTIPSSALRRTRLPIPAGGFRRSAWLFSDTAIS